jgi:hypothetical protein
MERQIPKKQKHEEFIEIQTRVISGESKVCKSCYTELSPEEFSINPETGEYYLSCNPCKKKKSEGHSNMIVEIIEKNKSLILENKCICTKCKTEKSAEDFDINKYTNKLNRQCRGCRVKDATYMANKKSSTIIVEQPIIQPTITKQSATNEVVLPIQKTETQQSVSQLDESSSDEKLVCKNCYVLLPVTRFSINEKTGEIYLSCDKCRNVKSQQRSQKAEKAKKDGKSMCNKCKRIFTPEQLGINPVTKTTYKQCQPCRLKDSAAHKEKRAN